MTSDPKPVDPLLPESDGHTTVKIAVPWFTKVSFAVTVLLVGLSFFLFSVTMLHNADDKADENEVLSAQNQVLKEQLATSDEITRKELECRSGRNAELLVVTSAIAGETAKLFYRLAERAETSTFQEILDNLNALADQRATAERQLRSAVEECRVSRPTDQQPREAVPPG